MHVVRFVHCVTLMGDYYALLRSRFALCLCGFLPSGFAATQHIRNDGLFMPVRLFLYSVDYGKTPTIQPSKALLQQPCIRSLAVHWAGNI